MTPDDAQKLAACALDGKGVIANADFGLCVRAEETAGGRVRLMVNPEPICGGYDGPALRSFMEETAVRWLSVVAPHRLNPGSDY